MEPLNLGSEGAKSSKRRLSSILKAPRTSMKLLGTEPEEPKEEIVKPVEKRNSRRVSFATTNNIRVFTNDAKRESPVLASIQNTHVGDRPDENMLRFVDEGSHQIKGLETLLTTPLYLSQHRENFFSDPVLQDDCVDRTMLLGENTGYMDITHSHTITIDKDYEIEEEPVQSCSFKVAQKVCGDLNVASKKRSPSESKAESKNAATDPDFSAFLAGMCLPTVNSIKPPNSENELGNVSCSANTSTMEIDKENHLPSFLMKQHPGGKSNPKQPQGLQRRRSRVSFVEDDNIDATMSHTVIIENKYNAQTHAPSISEDQGSGAFMASAFSNISDDMELTLSQTAAINVKVTGNITRNVQAALDHSRSHYFSEDEMEMMGAFDLKKDHTISMKEQSQSPITKTRRMSLFNVIGNEEKADQNNAGYFQSNLSIAKTVNSDDIEMKGASDISIREKEDSLFPKLSRISTFDALRNGEIIYQNKSGINLSTNLPPTVNNDDMEMTLCPSSGNKPFSNSRKTIPLASISRTVREDEHAGIIKEDALHPILRVSKISCFNMVENEEKLDHNKSGHLSTSQTANYDDMEMTQSQSIFLEAKQVSGDKPLSNSRKNWPHTSVSRTEDCDGKDITQALTGRIIQNTLLATKERGESILIPATTTSTERNESDCMDLTCQPSTFAGISPPSHDEMELTGCNTINIESNRTGLGSGDADTRRVPFSANQAITVDETMEMTEVHMAPVCERKYKALMTRRKSEARMSLIFDPEYTEADNCQANYTNPDHMDMTQCQTVVLEAENSKLFSKSKKSLNLVSTSSIPDVDGMEITQALTGSIMLKSFTSNKERRLEKNVLPTAQSCQSKDESKCMDLTCQVSASNLAMPCVDEMELTGCNTIAIDSKSTLAGSASEIKANENALWASTSVSKCTVSSEEQNEVSEADKCAINYVFPSKHAFDLDGKNLKCNNTETMSCDPADIQENKYCEMAHPSNVMMTDEKNDMQVTKILTVPVEIVSIDQRTENLNTSSCSRYEEDGQALWSNKEQSTTSIQHESSSSNESVVDSFSKEEPQHAKARRRSLADFQMELQNITRHIQEEQKVMTGSTTAPLPCAFPKISLKEQREMEVSSEPASIVTPNVKQKNSVQNEKTTPFSLKKPFSSRLSLCGIVPKLPKRSTTVTPHKTVTRSTNDLPSLQLEKHFDAVEQINNCKMVNINDEEFPEVSSEEDLSGSLENWPVNKQDELDDSLAIPIHEEPFEDEVFEPATNTSPCFKRPHPEEDYITAEQTKKAYISDMGPDCHEAAVQWEGNFTGHAAQNPKAKTIEDTGVSESTIRYSQIDSHMDGTLDHVFDFNKKLEDGSITVNEFLSHFGIKFVIHRSRPSILPDSCRAGDTRTMEDLLKEKYIYHPKQRVYEQDCKNLTEIVDRLKEQMPEQEKSLECINRALPQQIYTLSKEQLKSFGSKLKERKVYFGKRSKAHSHEMKGILYSELIKTTQDAKQSLISKIKETDEMIEDLDGFINDLETELSSVETTIMGCHLDAPQTKPFLKAKEEDLQRLNSAVTVKEREIDELEIQLRTLEGQQQRLQGESSSLKSHLATLNSLNEWRLDATDERGALFTFLHNTVHLQVNLQKPAGKEWMTEDVEQNIDVCFQLQLDVGKSECHASMVHKLLALYCQSQAKWTQRYPTTRHIPELLHDISLVVARLRLLGEEIHRLKKWGGLKLRILKITCMDTRVHIIFSSLKAFEKFELNLMVTPDYPFGPLHIQDFKKHTGNTRLSQIEDILSSVKPAKNYLTKVLKKIHDDLLC